VPAVTRLTLAEFVARWRRAHYPNLATNTRHHYDTALGCILPALGARTLSAIGREDLDSWRAGLQATHQDSSVRAVMAVLRTVFRAAVAWRYLARDPMAGVKRPRAQRPAIAPLTPGEFQQLLAAADAQWQAVLLLAVTGGLRIGEVVAARWEYLDAEGRTYRVSGTAVQRGGQQIHAPKTAQSAAPVHLSLATVTALQRHRIAQAARQLGAGLVDAGWMFTQPTGRPWLLSALRPAWMALQAQAGLPPRRFHDLRHTCAAWLIESGAHPKLIQEQLRHASITTTLDTYGHLLPQRTGEAVDRLDHLIG